MDDASGAASHDDRDEDDDEEYEENGGENRFLGFMFGNVDNAGDLDVDYLDEDAKEHLSALADKLGPSLTDIDMIKSSPASTDASEQDYDEKAENAIDYEDIDEQYDGPETRASTEEDHLLPKKDYYSSDAWLASLEHKDSVFDEENYDEDEEAVTKSEVVECNIEVPSLPFQDEQISQATSPDGCLPTDESLEPDHLAFELEKFQEESFVEQEQVEFRSEPSLPVLCVEDGMVILKFSEIFGVHEPLRKARKKEHRLHSIREW